MQFAFVEFQSTESASKAIKEAENNEKILELSLV